MGPSGAGAFGIAAYANVPTRPTNSRNALSERFIQLLSLGSAEFTSTYGASSVGGIIHNARRGAWARKELLKVRNVRTHGRGFENLDVPGAFVRDS